MPTLYIATVCFLNASNALLVVRKQGARAWTLPGGKLETGESAEKAALREVREALQLHLHPDHLAYLGAFEAAAAIESYAQVQAQVFIGLLPPGQSMEIGHTIEAAQWLSLNAPLPSDVAPLLREQIIPQLRKTLLAQPKAVLV